MLGLSNVSKSEKNAHPFVNKPMISVKSPSRSLSPSKSKKSILNQRKIETSDHRSIKQNKNSSNARELNAKMIASINWLKHSHIKREQMPSKLRSCFLITKSVIHTDN
jgi:hypothetical protein